MNCRNVTRVPIAAAGAIAIALAMASCATINSSYPRQESMAVPSETTRHTVLGQATMQVSAGQPEEYSGFRLLSDAVDALAARLVLASLAENTLDAQYYLIKADPAGFAFVRELLRAADRGVRVRLLIDDMFTSGQDVGLGALDHHPNFEIRVFNPFAHRSGRLRDGLVDFQRINRRMHNKSFTVDNQVTIVGGRNIADEYFGTRDDIHFGDLDFVALGPVVDEVSDSFDMYWNHERALPLPAFADMPADPEAALSSLRIHLDEVLAAVTTGVYAEALRQRTVEFLRADGEPMVWAPYELTVDSPDKSFKSRSGTATSILPPLAASFRAARDEILLVSPYFVPRSEGIAGLARLEQRGVSVSVITNSLAANNQFAVHSGYAPARKPLLKAGVALYEVRPDARFAGHEFIAASGAKSTLHTKAFVVDRKELFIGSFNFDPRSAYINTELGVIIRSPELAGAVARAIARDLPQQAWRVTLDGSGRLLWEGVDAQGNAMALNHEPQTSVWERFIAGLMRALPIKGQL